MPNVRVVKNVAHFSAIYYILVIQTHGQMFEITQYSVFKNL